MNRLLAIFLAALLATAPIRANAQLPLLGVGPGTLATSAPAGYTGPGDIVASAAMWWGFRAYSTATRGNKAANVCLPLDAACTDVLTDATTGALVTGTLTTLGCNNTTAICTVKTLYDQTGNGHDITQATIANRPLLVLSCISALPCMSFNGSSQVLVDSGLYTHSQPFSFDGAALAATGHSAAWAEFLAAGGNLFAGYATAGSFTGFAASGFATQTGAADDTWNGVGVVFNGASSIPFVNTSQGTGNPGSSGFGGVQVAIGGGSYGYLLGKVFEAGVWAAAFVSGDINGLSANQHAYGIY